MAELQAALRVRIDPSTPRQNAARMRLVDGTRRQSLGSAYTRPGGPAEGIPGEGSLAPTVDIVEQAAYGHTHVISAFDARDDTPISLVSGSIDLSDASGLAALRATGDASVATQLKAGEQPPLVRCTINGVSWTFVVESIEEPQAFGSSQVTIAGRSLGALADTPYQPVQQWTVDAPTTAAQISTLAQTFTGLAVDWQAPDWLIPAGAWSFSGSPFAVLRECAQAIGADIDPMPNEVGVTVRPRYAIAPNLWSTSPPDWQIHWKAVERSTSEVSDQPEYDSVIVAGQQQGGLLSARLAGTSGAVQAPMVTEALLTDLPALVERASSLLYLGGRQTRVVRTLQFGAEGVPARGMLIRFVDPDETWVGMVRSVAVNWSFGKARMSLGVERRLGFPAGNTAPQPFLLLLPPNPATGDVGVESTAGTLVLAAGRVAVPFNLASDLDATITPASGVLVPGTPIGFTITPLEAGTHQISVTNGAGARNPAPAEYVAEAVDVDDPVLLRLKFDGSNGQTTGIVNSGSAGVGTYNFVTGEGALSTASPKHGTACASVRWNGAVGGNQLVQILSGVSLEADQPFTCRFYANRNLATTNSTDPGALYQVFSWTFNDSGAYLFVGLNGYSTSAGQWKLYVEYDDGTDAGTNNYTLPTSGWAHVELGYDGSHLRVFVDGLVVATIPLDLSESSGTGGTLEAVRGFGWPELGEGSILLDDLDIQRGVCLHTSNFTPPGPL